jgi:hypothetical protein
MDHSTFSRVIHSPREIVTGFLVRTQHLKKSSFLLGVGEGALEAFQTVVRGGADMKDVFAVALCNTPPTFRRTIVILAADLWFIYEFVCIPFVFLKTLTSF